MTVRVNQEEKTLMVQQELNYVNTSNSTINSIILNDWNHAFSSKNSNLAKRFSDEYVRAFHLAKEEDRGYTEIKNVVDENFKILEWERDKDNIDIVILNLAQPLTPNRSTKITLFYTLKIPNDRFTKYGFNNDGKLYLKNWFLAPARFENMQFVKYSNENLDDISNAPTDYTVKFEIPKGHFIVSDLNSENSNTTNASFDTYTFTGKKRLDITFCITPKKEFTSYKNDLIEVSTNLESKLEDIDKAIIIDKITHFIKEKIGTSKTEKIIVSKEDYDRQPFYGLNQLPSFLSPFSDEFMFELMFLKTYTNNFLKNTLQLNPRKDQWIQDAIQVFVMMQYMDEFHPDMKMTGNLAKLKLLRSYHFINLDFNQQYNYLYMLMARKNLDQPLSTSKNKLIKFNEQIANKYKAGLSLRYLDSYLDNDVVENTIKEFIILNQNYQTNHIDFEMILKNKTSKNIDWFFNTIINSRDLIDFKIAKVSKTEDEVILRIKNKTKTNVPISVYQLKKDSIISKEWVENIKTDTTLVFSRNEATKFVLNYNNEVPEYNLRNNWKSLKGFFFNHRPLKFNFYKDLEEPNYNQIFYMPEFEYNLYDGISLGVRLNNRSMLNKPFNFSIAPFYSTNTGTIIGNFSASVDDYIRDDSKLYRIIYGLTGNQSHYAPNAKYTRIIPSIQFIFRDRDFRTNKKEYIQIKQFFIDKEIPINSSLNNNDAKLSVFSAAYTNSQSEITKVFNISNQVQISNSFGNITTEINYRKLFENNRQLSLRFFAGKFIYSNTTNNSHRFGLEKPVDLTFQTNLLGRSESVGLFSQQFVYSEGGFKSKLDTRFANNWMTTINGSLNIWNWVQIYGDVGLLKNHFEPTKFLYDSGIHLNLVPDYFELFLPVQSSNGFELNDKNYGQKIRFIITISPKTLVSLFTRKWF
ncbi:M1 family metallopeptidase [Flavobacterium jejuense]|uniref:M1 family metallopeptidase n=1 Tax=Flavobacterium jejuense TaxID=1544455 RepID=A0ABX0IKE2_9FLAO|nr:M1 family metallopeptidase [Flavobacterium jejuense]